MDNAGSTLPLAPIFDITRDIRGMHPRPSGVGGQSDVYAAFWASPYEYMPVAIKVLRFAGDLDEKIRKRLDSEISLWGRVSHPNVQRLLGVCFLSTSALPAMVSEWHPNGDITAYLKTKLHDCKLQEIKYRLLVEVLEGVGYLHEHHIVHGDIKGANVLIAKDGSARLSDFGFSIILTEHSRSLSQWSAAKGTIRWMAPEFFDEDDRVATHTRASDVWAIGCLIIEVQTGDLPYSTKRFEPSVILAISRGELPAPQPFEPDAVWQLVRICCQVDPPARYTTPQLLSRCRIERLTAYVEADPVSAILEHPRWCNTALLDVRHHIRACSVLHSPLEPSMKRVFRVLGVPRLYWEGELEVTFQSIEYSACKLLKACVDVAQQQPPTDTAIQFMINTVPLLLHMWGDLFQVERPKYIAEILRPLAKVLAEHGDASVSPILMRLCAYAPGLFRIGTEDSGALTTRSGASGFFRLAENKTAWSGDGTLFAVADGDSVTIVQPGKTLSRSLTMEESLVTDIAMSPDGQRLACSTISGPKVTISLWDIPRQSALDIGTTPAHIGRTQDLVLSQDGLCLASAHIGRTQHLVPSQDGLCLASIDDGMHIWRVGKNPQAVQLDMPPGTVRSNMDPIAFTADSRLVVVVLRKKSGGSMVALGLWDLHTAALVTVSELTPAPYDRSRVLPSQGPYLILATELQARLCLYGTLSGRLVCSLKTGGGSDITCADSSRDGAYAAAGTPEGFVYVWDVETTTLLENSPLPIHRDKIVRLTFTSDGTKIITLTEDGEVCVSDIRGSWLRWDL